MVALALGGMLRHGGVIDRLYKAISKLLHNNKRTTFRSSGSTVGTPGVPWGATERADWLSMIAVKRSYQDEVVAKIETRKV